MGDALRGLAAFLCYIALFAALSGIGWGITALTGWSPGGSTEDPACVDYGAYGNPEPC